MRGTDPNKGPARLPRVWEVLEARHPIVHPDPFAVDRSGSTGVRGSFPPEGSAGLTHRTCSPTLDVLPVRRLTPEPGLPKSELDGGASSKLE